MFYDKTPKKCYEISNYCLLDDGRIWSVSDACFVKSIPKGQDAGRYVDSYGVASIEGLLMFLNYHHFNKGDLKTNEEYANEAREKRNKLLSDTDYMMMPDYPNSEAERTALAAYRQALRDIPAQTGFPRYIQWPVEPNL